MPRHIYAPGATDPCFLSCGYYGTAQACYIEGLFDYLPNVVGRPKLLEEFEVRAMGAVIRAIRRGGLDVSDLTL